MNIIYLIIHIFEYVVYSYFALAAIYVSIFAIGSLFQKKQTLVSTSRLRKVAVLIPGYKEDNVIVEVAEKALIQNYPTEKFDVVIIADSFQPETIANLKKLPH